MSKLSFQLGIMPASPCTYLPSQNERIAVVLDEKCNTHHSYSQLIQHGYRRSGSYIYRPHCDLCHACQSLRVNVNTFTPSKSQKRQINQLKRLKVVFKSTLDENWFPLYERYINHRHKKGSMYPADMADFISFIQCDWQKTCYMHVYQNDLLIAVGVTDIVDTGLSALYSFFEPEHHWSLGSLCVLAQIQEAKTLALPWLYLGFQIDNCSAMNYKKKFTPHERYIEGEWKVFLS